MAVEYAFTTASGTSRSVVPVSAIPLMEEEELASPPIENPLLVNSQQLRLLSTWM